MRKKTLISSALLVASIPSVSALLARVARPPATQGEPDGARRAGTRRALRQAVRAKVLQIIIDELGVDEKDVTPNARCREDLGADSLDTVELIMRLEEEFGFRIADEDIDKLVRVKDVYDYVERRMAQRRPRAGRRRAGSEPKANASNTPAPALVNSNSYNSNFDNSNQSNLNANYSSTSNTNAGNWNSNAANVNPSNANLRNSNAANTNTQSLTGNFNSALVAQSLQINERRAGDVVILELKGKFEVGGTSIELRKQIASLLNDRNRKFVIDLSGVELNDSREASAFVSSVELVRKVRGQIKLLRPSRRMRGLLAALRAGDAFEVYADEASALASFRPAAAPARRTYATRREVEEAVRAVIAETLGARPDEVKPDAHVVSDLGADSLEKVDLIVRLEEEFGVEITDEDAKHFEFVSNYHRHVWLQVRRRPR